MELDDRRELLTTQARQIELALKEIPVGIEHLQVAVHTALVTLT